ncbi:MAG: hypothetical protein D6706_08790 [Chloroflexi bacterium]|nr:MAG: hypothetical protein D6706_08790 [Chloroflexota bacterium]
MRKIFVLLAVLVTAVALVACGGGASEPSGPEPVSFTVKGFDEFKFDPADLTVQSGAEVTLTFENEGALEHSWVLVSGDADPITVTDADAIAGISSGKVAGGESTTFTFTAPEAGTYTIVCTVPGHAAGGMVGKLTVNP